MVDLLALAVHRRRRRLIVNFDANEGSLLRWSPAADLFNYCGAIDFGSGIVRADRGPSRASHLDRLCQLGVDVRIGLGSRHDRRGDCLLSKRFFQGEAGAIHRDAKRVLPQPPSASIWSFSI